MYNAAPLPQPSSASAQASDPIAGGDACARVADESVAGTVVFDFPSPGAGGYTVLGSAAVIASPRSGSD